MNFVLDASVALAWAFEDEDGEYARGILARLEKEEACTTALWPLEISNGLLAAERRDRIEAADSARFTRLLLSLPIVVESGGRPSFSSDLPEAVLDTAQNVDGKRALARNLRR